MEVMRGVKIQGLWVLPEIDLFFTTKARSTLDVHLWGVRESLEVMFYNELIDSQA